MNIWNLVLNWILNWIIFWPNSMFDWIIETYQTGLAPGVGDKFQVWLGVKVWGSYEYYGSFQLSVNIQALCTKAQNQQWTKHKLNLADQIWSDVMYLYRRKVDIGRKKTNAFSLLTIPSSSWQVANMTFTYNWHLLTATLLEQK